MYQIWVKTLVRDYTECLRVRVTVAADLMKGRVFFNIFLTKVIF